MYSQAPVVDDLDHGSDAASLELGGRGGERAVAQKDGALIVSCSAYSQHRVAVIFPSPVC